MIQQCFADSHVRPLIEWSTGFSSMSFTQLARSLDKLAFCHMHNRPIMMQILLQDFLRISSQAVIFQFRQTVSADLSSCWLLPSEKLLL
jgi:hypothetical protein